MNDSKVRVLLDIDGVAADFLSSAFKIINEVSGRTFRVDDLPSWEIFEHVGKQHEEACYARFREEGFCARLLPYAGAVEGVERLRAIADVRALTSPIHGPHWYYERAEWCRRYLGIQPSMVYFVKHKHLLHGDIMIDDRVEHVEQWADAHPRGIGLLWHQSYNRHEIAKTSGGRVWRARSWDDVVAAVRTIESMKGGA